MATTGNTPAPVSGRGCSFCGSPAIGYNAAMSSAVPREERSFAPAGQITSVRQLLSDYLSLMKPGIVSLVLFTTLAGLWLASGGLPPARTALWTLLGTGLAAAAAASLNNYLDRELDRLMPRTRSRPLPAGRLRPIEALLWGALLGAFALFTLALRVNALAAGLAAAALLSYVPLYTVLKRTTPWAILMGGITGALPPMIGWAAAAGRLEPGTWVLFGILFLWQIPHFWALALYKREEYARAGLPLLPVVAGEDPTWRQIVLYIAVLIPVSLLLSYPLGVVGAPYAAVALLLGVGFLFLALRGLRLSPGPERERAARAVFLYSLLYLPALSLAMFLSACATGAGGI